MDIKKLQNPISGIFDTLLSSLLLKSIPCYLPMHSNIMAIGFAYR